MPPPPEAAPASSLQVIAMHGWAGDGLGWDVLRRDLTAPGWHWSCGERGYGGRTPGLPAWAPSGRRLLIGHSMGPHLLPPSLLAQAEAVVLLASFARFVPPGREGRRLQKALAGMAAQLEEGPEEHESAQRAQQLLQTFLQQAAAPDPPELLPRGPASRPVGPEGRRRLRQDLDRLAASEDLPPGFPGAVPVLIVEGGADRIVGPEARALLRDRLPQAEVLSFEGAGHCLLQAPLASELRRWIGRTLGG
ncbi:alpha/beta hydrolase [Cyanobium sp. FGCU-6]|jgi:pimeloyl-[acyl-carrier protein] methyl ester esterase|nr:alpha/beta hydrolase [Cyanobium sp. FGCU6]